MTSCDTCAHWGLIEDAVGWCDFTSKHTAAGFWCSNYQNRTQKGAKVANLPPGVKSGPGWYARLVKKLQPGHNISTTRVVSMLGCSYLEGAALIEKLESDGRIKALNTHTITNTKEN